VTEEFALDIARKLGEEELRNLIPYLHSTEKISEKLLLNTLFSDLGRTAQEVAPNLMWLLQGFASKVTKECDVITNFVITS